MSPWTTGWHQNSISWHPLGLQSYSYPRQYSTIWVTFGRFGLFVVVSLGVWALKMVQNVSIDFNIFNYWRVEYKCLGFTQTIYMIIISNSNYRFTEDGWASLLLVPVAMASSSSSLDEKPAISSPIFSSLFLSNQINLFYNMAYNWYTNQCTCLQ